MTKPKKTNPILILILIIPTTLLMSYLYYCGIKEFVNYLSNGEFVVADVTSTEKKVGKYRGCTFYYNYIVEGQQYSGSDSISAECLEKVGKINVFYLKDIPKKSIIGLDIFLLFSPISIILFLLVSIRKYRNSYNREEFCIFYMTIDSIFLVLSSMAIAFYTFHPLQVKDSSSSILGGYIIIACIFAIYDLYKNFIKYGLYKNGSYIDAVIIDIKDELSSGPSRRYS